MSLERVLPLQTIAVADTRPRAERLSHILASLPSAFLMGSAIGGAFVVPGTLGSAALATLGALGCAFLTTRTNAAPKKMLLNFYVVGLGIQLVGFYWIPLAIAAYTGASQSITLLGSFIVALFGALQFLVVGALCSALGRTFLGRLQLGLPIAWVATELWFPALIPWNLGAALFAISPLRQCADLCGVALLTLLLLWIATAVVSRPRLALLLHPAALTLVAALTYGLARERGIASGLSDTPKLQALLVQGALDPRSDFVPERRDENIRAYRLLTAAGLRASSTELVIWPESTVRYDFRPGEVRITRGTERDPFPGLGVPIIFGSQTLAGLPRDPVPQYYNSAHLLNPDGTLSGPYRKQRLFPFSEINPLEWLFSPRVEEYRLVPGRNERTLKFSHVNNGSVRTVNIAAAICFEDLWPTLLRSTARQGADFLLALSSDSWFLHSQAAAQHHLLASFRAVELRRSLVRATTSGVTGVVNPLGETVASIEPFVPGYLHAAVPLYEGSSPYSLFGDLPLVALCLFSVFAAALALLGKASFLCGRS